MRLAVFSALAVMTIVALSALLVLSMRQNAQACSRILYETGIETYITGRGMDWNDPTAKTALWVFPRGMERDGGIGKNPLKWTSKYGSVVASFYDAGTADVYLVETDYGDAAKTGKPTISVGAWLQYFLDNSQLGQNMQGQEKRSRVAP